MQSARRPETSATRNPKQIQFPVAANARAFEEAVRQGRIAGMSEAARARTESLQPYRAASPDQSVLELLHFLDIQDKHRRPLVTTHAALMGQGIRLNGNLTAPVTIILPAPPSDGAFNDEAEGEALRYLSYESDEDQPDLQADFDLAIDVVLRHGAEPSPRPLALDEELRHLLAFTGFALAEYEQILRSAH